MKMNISPTVILLMGAFTLTASGVDLDSPPPGRIPAPATDNIVGG